MHQLVLGKLLSGFHWSWFEILESTHSPNVIMSRTWLKTPEELFAIIDRWEGEKAAIAKDITSD